MEKNLPIYNISIDPKDGQGDEKLGMSMIAYTATPAIITKGMAFDAVKPMQFADELKYRLAAPILIPNLPIDRKDDDLGEYQVVFSKEVIEDLYLDFMQNKDKSIFNLDHNSSLIAPSYILESWITGPSATDPSFTKYGVELPEGSIFVVSQFTDKEYFKSEIIDKQRLGYSIEAFLNLVKQTIKQTIKNKLNQTKMENEIKLASLLADGEYPMADGSILVIKDGQIAEVTPVKEEKPTEDKPVEEKMADAIPVDAPVADVAPVEEAKIDEAQIMAIVQPKLDEIYKLLAELKTQVEADATEDVTEDATEMKKTKMSSQLDLVGFFTALQK